MKCLVTPCLILSMAACSPSGTHSQTTDAHTAPSAASATTATPTAAVAAHLKLYAMDCGNLEFSDVELFADDGTMKGVARSFVDPCYLIRHADGDLIWDTGVPETIADSPDGLRPEGIPVHIVVTKKLSVQLGELGLSPKDIEFVAFSHKHFDHVGNANLFAAATWIVDAGERAAMFSDEARATDDFAAYRDLENAKTVQIEGDKPYDVFADGSVVIHQAPGHTPGHTVLMVRLPKSGPILLTGDMWHLRESRVKRLVPSFNFNREQTLASMDKVEALASETGARVVRQHVPEDFAALPAFPASLE